MSAPRRAKRFLSAEQKYDLWVRMLTGQLTASDAAAEVGVDRSTIVRIKAMARDGALSALAAKPGRSNVKKSAAEIEADELRREVERLTSTVVDQAVELTLLRGKTSWG